MDELLPSVDVNVAVAVQDLEEGDCAAAVEHWKDAFSNFGSELPPAYEKGKSPYDTPQNVSFVALFSPKDDPGVMCVHAKCPSTSGTNRAAEAENPDNTLKEPNGRRLNGAEAAGGMSAIVCAVGPKVLTENKRPFT